MHAVCGSCDDVIGFIGGVYTRADAESILPAAAVVDHGIDPDHVVLVVRLLMEGLRRAAIAMR